MLGCLVPRPFLTESPTEAALSRLIHLHKPTLLLDEYDSWLPDGKTLVSLLNSGHRLGQARLRCGGRSGLQVFDVYGPVALGGIGELPPTLRSRSLVVRMTRCKPSEARESFDVRLAAAELILRRKAARWVHDHQDQLRRCRPTLPPGALNRVADNWRPLVAVAEVAGGEWPTKAAKAFELLSEGTQTKAIGTELLFDIRDLFFAIGADRLASQDIVLKLRKLEGRPWMDSQGSQPIDPHRLATILRPYGISPTTIRFDGKLAKGYCRCDFQDAFDRFLS